MQAQPNDTGGPAVTSQDQDLEARVSALEDGHRLVVRTLEKMVVANAGLETLLSDIVAAGTDS